MAGAGLDPMFVAYAGFVLMWFVSLVRSGCVCFRLAATCTGTISMYKGTFRLGHFNLQYHQ